MATTWSLSSQRLTGDDLESERILENKECRD